MHSSEEHKHDLKQNHQHSHHSHTHHNNHSKTLWIVLLLSVVYLIAEVVGGILSGSLALLADAGHMTLDVAATALGLFAAWIARRPPTFKKTYGYYRAEILAALFNGVTLIGVSLWIFVEAVERFYAPKEIHTSLMILIALGGLLVNLFSLFLLHGKKEDSLNMQGVWLHLVTDALGSFSALVAGFAVQQFQFFWADSVASVLIALLVLYGSWKLLVDCVDVLLVSVPKGIDLEKIRQEIQAMPQVVEIHDLHVWVVSTSVNAFSAHVRLKKEANYTETLDAISTLLHERHHIDHITVQLEPFSYSHGGHLQLCH